MSSSIISPKIREMIVAKRMGFKQNLNVNGCDCFDKDGKPWEIKTEQISRLLGRSNWSSSSPENMKKYLNQRVLQAGFTTQGKLAYIVSFSFKEAKIMNLFKNTHLTRGIPMGVCGWAHLSSLQFHYSNKKYLTPETSCSTLREVLNANFR